MSERGNIWYCKIGESAATDLPPGSDSPMRRAIERAYIELTGQEPEFIFSGWGQELDESERAVVEDRLPNPSVIVRQQRRLAATATKAAWDAEVVAKPKAQAQSEALEVGEGGVEPPALREDELKQLAVRAVATLRHLVDLKDGPRDSVYEGAKPKAWQAARDVLDEITRTALDAASGGPELGEESN